MLKGKLTGIEWLIKTEKKIKDWSILKKEVVSSFEAITPSTQPTLQTLANFIDEEISLKERQSEEFINLIKQKKRILVYGDYDVDGITSSYLLATLIKKLAKEVKVYLPHRIKDGYGVKADALMKLRKESDFDLLLTVDNGVNALPLLQRLRDQRLAVGVIDHHLLNQELPSLDFSFHNTRTSAAGLVTALAYYFYKKKLIDDLTWQEFLQVGSLGVVADQMPLQGYNYLLTKLGLLSYQKKGVLNKGLGWLLKQANWQNRQIDEYAFNFIIAPRLNASGRLASASLAFKLLSWHHPQRLAQLSLELEKLNYQRQKLTLDFMNQSQELLENLGDFILYYHPDIPDGLLGLVAGKLAQKYHLPALVVSGKSELKGSGRSEAEFNLTKVLSQLDNVFTSIGGHKKAVGFSLQKTNLYRLRQALRRLKVSLSKGKEIDYVVDLSALRDELAFLVKDYAPFGQGRKRPLFYLENHDWQVLPLGNNNKHYRLIASHQNHRFNFLLFNLPSTIKPQEIKRIVFVPEVNEFRGHFYPQFRVIDII